MSLLKYRPKQYDTTLRLQFVWVLLRYLPEPLLFKALTWVKNHRRWVL